jgi:putative SOS response-associated peptidase YedK
MLSEGHFAPQYRLDLELVGGIHDRMPVMLVSADYDRWLGQANSADELKSLLGPYDADLMCG